MNNALKTVLLSILALSAGCATITRGTREVIEINSDPVGAIITLSNGQTGKTPATFELKRKGIYIVTIEKEGYESVQLTVQGTVSGGGAAGMAGNVVAGGIIGIGVDAVTGATKNLKPNPINVKLVPVKSNAKPNQTSLDPLNLQLNVRSISDEQITISVEATT